MDVTVSALHARIYEVVRLIPHGRVATYGQIAAHVGRCGPRQVGTALARLPARSDVPWQRVINAKGEISVRKDGSPSDEQSRRLRDEGVVFERRGRIDLERYQWTREEMLWAQPCGRFLGDEH
ncbi:MAG: cysteine methyltransferase [Gammaproteobacteria bacterium]|nr:cysteine methyltransferase [Gammaproteobacteria bacterium]